MSELIKGTFNLKLRKSNDIFELYPQRSGSLSETRLLVRFLSGILPRDSIKSAFLGFASRLGFTGEVTVRELFEAYSGIEIMGVIAAELIIDFIDQTLSLNGIEEKARRLYLENGYLHHAEISPESWKIFKESVEAGNILPEEHILH